MLFRSVGVTDRGLGGTGQWLAFWWVKRPAHLQKTTAVLGAVGGDDLEAGDLAVPRCREHARASAAVRTYSTPTQVLTGVVLRVLSSNTSSGSVRSTENNRARDVPASTEAPSARPRLPPEPKRAHPPDM